VTKDNRFKISAIPISSDIITESESNNEYKQPIKIFNSKKDIVVNNKSNFKGDLYVYDMTGKFLQELPFKACAITCIPIKLPTGIYIVKAITVDNEVTKYLIFRE
jgi:hypothetical protein